MCRPVTRCGCFDCWSISDMVHGACEVSARVDLVGPDQTIHRDSALVPDIEADEQEVLTAQAHTAQCVFGHSRIRRHGGIWFNRFEFIRAILRAHRIECYWPKNSYRRPRSCRARHCRCGGAQGSHCCRSGSRSRCCGTGWSHGGGQGAFVLWPVGKFRSPL